MSYMLVCSNVTPLDDLFYFILFFYANYESNSHIFINDIFSLIEKATPIVRL